MAAFLYLGPAVLAVGAAVVHFVSPRALGTVRAIAVLGSGFGVALVIAANDVGPWRATVPAPTAGAIAGAAAATAWLIVAVRASAGARPAIATGVAASALALFAASDWVVPALLFLACALGAVAALVSLGIGRSLAWLAIAAAGAMAASALGFAARDIASWEFVEPTGLYLAVAYGAAIVAAGVLPVFVWQAAGTGSAAIPLLIGSGFVVLARVGGDADPGVAAALLLLALALAAGAWISRLTIVAVGAWSSATFAAISFASRDAVALAGIAAVITAGAIALWPHSRGRGRLSRGLMLSFAPPTIAFGAVVAAEARAFTQTSASSSTDVAWSAVAALLPLVLAAGVVIGCGAARTGESDDFEPEAVLGTWVLLAVAIAGGAFLQAVVDVPPVVAHTSLPFVYPLALTAGLVVAVRTASPPETAPPLATEVAVGLLALPRWLERLLAIVAAALGVATIAGVTWVTFDGLSVGFL